MLNGISVKGFFFLNDNFYYLCFATNYEWRYPQSDRRLLIDDFNAKFGKMIMPNLDSHGLDALCKLW